MACYYADDSERVRLIAGFRALATFLEDQSDVPAPRWVSVLVFPPDGADSEKQSEIDRIAALTGTEPVDDTAEGRHYTVSACFGPVEYRAVAIPQKEDPTVVPAKARVAGIRSEDRNKTLKGNPRTYAEAGTRRVTGAGTRNNNEDGS